jgi:hypothetical protein
MDLLSAVGVVTKRRPDYYGQAETLAKKTGSQEALEERMTKESKSLVKGLRDKQLKWSEYERSLLDKTLTSALASVYLGAGNSKPRERMEAAWPSIVGDMMPPLVKFMSETEAYLNDGTLRVGDSTLEFDEIPEDVLPDSFLDDTDPKIRGDIEAGQGRAVGKTWPGLASRVARYLATSTFAFVALGAFMVAQDQGHKYMRRIARHDKRTCPDCKDYDSKGWQEFGSLPMPGKGCRCYDRCRCYVEYK